MWDTDYNLFSRGSNRKEGTGIDTVAAMVLGIGIGIAAWQMINRKQGKCSTR